MPKEIRKRGKKFKKQNEEPPDAEPQPIIESKGPESNEGSTLELPFGELSNEVKAYFRSVDIQLRDWEGDQEEKSLLYIAALTEMKGNEQKLATDPESSVILERMIPEMDDFVRRVFMDSLCGSFEQLSTNRFSSHVIQTLFTTSYATISRESHGRLPEIAKSHGNGELRTLTQLILDITAEISPSFSKLATDPYAAHVLHSLVSLLSGIKTEEKESRSKRSTNYKSKQGLTADKGKEAEYIPPPSFLSQAYQVLSAFLDASSENEVRSLISQPFSCNILQLLLNVESTQDVSSRKLYGILSLSGQCSVEQKEDYLASISRDPVSSHIAQALFTFAPTPSDFDSLWQALFSSEKSAAYNRGSPLWRALLHPITNHVLSHAIQFADTVHLEKVFAECDNLWKRVIMEEGRWGILTAVGNRLGALSSSPDENAKLDELKGQLKNAYCATFGLPEEVEEVHKWFVECVLTMQGFSDVQNPSSKEEKTITQDSDKPWSKDFNKKKKKVDRHIHHPQLGREGEEQLEHRGTTVQGSILLQSLLRIPGIPSKLVVDSLSAMSAEKLHSLVIKDEKGSRLFDVLFAVPSASSTQKPTPGARALFRRLLQLGFLDIINDKYGSYLGEKIWSWGDGYVKSKIREALLPHTGKLSKFGKIFVYKCQIDLRRNRDTGWSAKGGNARTVDHHKIGDESTKMGNGNDVGKSKKRPQDEIDEAFGDIVSGSKGKFKKAKLNSDEKDAGETRKGTVAKPMTLDNNLKSVLDAIK